MIIVVERAAAKDIIGISEPFKNQIKKKIAGLQNYPNLTNIKKLKNYSPTHRLRVGNYRVLFDVEDDKIIIGRIKHRKEAY
ncbi:MAG: plasmid stabilization protein [Arcobacter sp.]|nr:MAG: plasmid stabilization protein [Arcobacter sp.]